MSKPEDFSAGPTYTGCLECCWPPVPHEQFAHAPDCSDTKPRKGPGMVVTSIDEDRGIVTFTSVPEKP